MDNTTVKVSKNRQKKEQLVAELVEKKVDAEFVAVKNTLLELSLAGKIDKETAKEHFKQPTGALFIYSDVIDPLKELTKTIKEFKMPVIKFGILDGKIVTEQEVTKLATLPPLPVLRAQLLGQMKAPISGLHRALNWNLQQLVVTLNAIKDKKTA
jgi:large subunit ribosomal protein L10